MCWLNGMKKTKILIILIALFFLICIPLSSAGNNHIKNICTKTLESKTSEKILTNKNYDNDSVIIICGGRGKGDPCQQVFENSANHAYKTFKSLSYSDEDITYLCSNISSNGVDSTDTIDNISNAITNWLSGRMNNDSNYFIFIIDHGDELTGRIKVSDGYIYPLDLKRWLDTVNCYKTGIILISSCYSGKFIPYLTNPKRIIMTDTDDSHKGFDNFYESIFQKAFFDELEKRVSYGKAWMAGDKSQDRVLHYIYIPGMKQYFKYKHSELYERFNTLRMWWFFYWMYWQIGFGLGNSLIDDNGDGIGHGTWRIDRLPINI